MRVIEQWWDRGGIGSDERSALDPTGQELLQQIEQRLSQHKNIVGSRDPQSASEVLRDAGIPGIRYLDQGSRGTGEGTHNYVVFNDKLIDIIRKYGLAGLIAAGAAHFKIPSDTIKALLVAEPPRQMMAKSGAVPKIGTQRQTGGKSRSTPVPIMCSRRSRADHRAIRSRFQMMSLTS